MKTRAMQLTPRFPGDARLRLRGRNCIVYIHQIQNDRLLGHLLRRDAMALKRRQLSPEEYDTIDKYAHSRMASSDLPTATGRCSHRHRADASRAPGVAVRLVDVGSAGGVFA